MSYPSDLSDAQWEKIEKFFGRADPRGAREKHSKRRLVEAILYRLREGCRWRALPHDFAPWSTVASHFRLWRRRGLWQEALAVLGTRWREVSLGRSRRAPRHAILDSQSVKTAAEGEEHGFHGGKRLKGRSRHVAVDSQGTLLAVRITAANRADSAEAAAVMVQAVERHPSLESFTADKGYQRQAEAAAREQLGCDLHLSAKPAQKKASRPLPSAGGLSAPSPGWASAGCSPKTTKRPSPAPRLGFGAP
jgi:putative transposase